MDKDIIILDDIVDDPDDLYGSFICIENPEGFDLKVGKSYEWNGCGSLTWNTLWTMDMDISINSSGHSFKYTDYYSSNEWEEKTVLIPTEIVSRYFVHNFRFKDSEHMWDYIRAHNRNKEIEKLLK